jgi:hypothetical protein
VVGVQTSLIDITSIVRSFGDEGLVRNLYA